MSGKHTKWNINKITDFVNRFGDGDILLSEIYVPKNKLDFYCHVCGNVYSTRLMNFVKGMRCGKCRYIKVSKSKTVWTDDAIREFVLENGDTDVLLSIVLFKGKNSKLEVRCGGCGIVYYPLFCNYRKGHRCRRCSAKNINYDKKKTINEIVEFVNVNGGGDTLLSEEYENSKEDLMFLCHRCEKPYYISWSEFKQGNRCGHCKGKRISERRTKWTIDSIKCYIDGLHNGDELLSTVYIPKNKIEILCGKCGNPYAILLTNYFSGKRCKKCANKKLSQLKTYTKEQVNEIIVSQGCVWIDGKYEGNKSILTILCSCKKNIIKIRFSDIQRGHKCRECGNEKIREKSLERSVREDNNLSFCYPEIAKEWDYLKNDTITPEKVAPKAQYKAWWLCKNGHSFQTPVRNRTSLGRGCPYCAKYNGKASKDKNLALLHPYLCEEWDYSKNDLGPDEYLPRSKYTVSWICKKCNHHWDACISNRVAGTGCPVCYMSGGAKKILFFLNDNNIKNIPEYEFDDLLSDMGNPLRFDFAVFDGSKIKMLIEFDGDQHNKFLPHFHRDMDDFLLGVEYDNRKNKYAHDNDIKLLRMTQKDFKNIEKILSYELNM